MEIGWRFGTGSADGDFVEESGKRGYGVPDGGVWIGYWIGDLPRIEPIALSQV